LTNVSISAEEALANFNHTLENFEEVAKQGDMSADELKERLDDLKPVFDDLSRQIETKVSSRVELLTEVFGYAADEADQLARSLNNIDFNRLAAQNFNNVARDATGAFGFNVIAADTTANRTMLQRTQGGLEAQIRSMFGGDLDLAAQSEEGMRLIEALYTNIFTQSMLEEGQEARGAEFTAGQMLETIFGPSQFTEEFIANNIDLLEKNKTIAELIGEGNDSLEVIAEKLDFAFGGRAEDVLRDRLGEKFDQEFAGNVMGGAYTQARAAYIDQNIGTAMGNMLSISNPISVDLEINGLITEDVKQQIIEIVETQTARMGEDLTDAVNDTVSGNGMTVIGTRGRVRVSEGTTTSNSNGLESGETATSRRRGT
jgi:polyhydroxyalkanoate synthesis regulator phasin